MGAIDDSASMLRNFDSLWKGEAIGPRLPAKFLTSANNVYRLWVQTDGNVVIYKSFNNWANQVAIWGLQKVNPAGVANPVFIHQTDGNLCLYHNGVHQWSTATNGKLTTRLIMQSDGNLCLYWGTNPLWCSHTNGK